MDRVPDRMPVRRIAEPGKAARGARTPSRKFDVTPVDPFCGVNISEQERERVRELVTASINKLPARNRGPQ